MRLAAAVTHSVCPTRQVRGKYDAAVFDLFTELFELLPLAFVIAKKALVVHGGLWRHRGVSLSQLRKLDAKRQCPEAPQSYDEYLFFDILWSDPHPDDADGVHESSRGDGCVLFGKDITAEFLRRNSLQLVIRSHQLPSDGTDTTITRISQARPRGKAHAHRRTE